MTRRFALVALALAAAFTTAARAEVKAEFHQTYPLAAGGRVAVNNINGFIHITAWDRDEVKVDAVKTGRSQTELDEARIIVDASSGSVSVRTKYPQGENNHTARVDYTLTVPRRASLDRIESVNGSVTVEDVAGNLHVNSVNGRIELRRASGNIDAGTVNGALEATVNKLGRNISLHAVNGKIRLAIPPDAGAHLKASTVSGGISSNFDLPVRHAGFGPGASLESTIGNGASSITLNTVNGGIELNRSEI